ncbi:MAG TPA: hypothetical protein VFC99_03115 [Acidimicrobiia bacterium]|nr:hypothetical protein [Acidimicrobiia bacterium]
MPLNLSLLNFSALAKKNALKAKNAKQQSLLGTGSSIIAAPATAAATVPVANPAASPATDPEVRVAGKEATRKAVAQRLLDTSGSSGDSIWPTVALIGAVAVLPIVGAFALGSGDIRKWFRRSESDA